MQGVLGSLALLVLQVQMVPLDKKVTQDQLGLQDHKDLQDFPVELDLLGRVEALDRRVWEDFREK